MISRSTGPLRIIVHGGMHKTGTTSLQHLLAANRNALLKEGICYPDVEETHHQMLNVKRADWVPDTCLECLDQARQMGAETVIFSSEVVSTLSVKQFRTLTASLSHQDLTYLFCFRHWWDYFPSRWSQNCSRRDTQTFDSYVQAVAHCDSEHPDYRFDLVLDRAVSSGNCRVAAVSYDTAMATEGSVLPELLRAAGLREAAVKLLDSRQIRDNARHDGTVIELCRLFNGLVADRNGWPQDDLFRSVAEYRRCLQMFDLVPAIAALGDAVRDEMVAIVADHGFKKASLPDVRHLELALLNGYGSLFTNKAAGRIFPVRRPDNKSYSQLVWQDFRDALNGDPLQMLGLNFR